MLLGKNSRQQRTQPPTPALAYVQTEINAVLREQLAAAGYKPRLTDKQRPRLALVAKSIPRLVAADYDGSSNRRRRGGAAPS